MPCGQAHCAISADGPLAGDPEESVKNSHHLITQ